MNNLFDKEIVIKNIDKIIKVSLYLLLVWYFISLYVVCNDNTIDFGMKMAGEIINFLMIIMLSRVIKFGYKNANFTDFSVIIMLTFWFFYSTIRDYNDNGYGFLLKIFYVSIDLLSTIFCIDSFINFICNSNMFIFSKYEISRIGNILKISICVIFTFLCFNFYRHLK